MEIGNCLVMKNILVAKFDGLGDWVIFSFYLNQIKYEFDSVYILCDQGSREYIYEKLGKECNIIALPVRGKILYRMANSKYHLISALARKYYLHLIDKGIKGLNFDLCIFSCWNKKMHEIFLPILSESVYGCEIFSPVKYWNRPFAFRGDFERVFLEGVFDKRLKRLIFKTHNKDIRKIFIFANSFKKEKRWGDENFKSLSEILNLMDYETVIWGMSESKKLKMKYCNGSIKYLIRNLRSCQLYIGNDTGVLHMAIQEGLSCCVIHNGKQPNSFLKYPGDSIIEVCPNEGNDIKTITIENVLHALKISEILK